MIAPDGSGERDDRRERDERTTPRAEHVRALRVGHGGNCSSVGSVVDTLFLGAAAGGAIVAAVLAAMSAEGVRVVGTTPDGPSASGADRDETSDENRTPREDPR